ncbi:MAG: hypothetical protein NT002_04360 [candidate division Zixibacteria bacterium]|nr:hypothetical protein [candidate division Zixibacteria bacterium]
MSNEDELLKLAKEKFSDFSPADETFFTAVANGEPADYSSEKEEDNDPAGGDKWGEERVLKADRINWLCADRKAKEMVSHKGIRVNGARIEGEVDLEESRVDFSFLFWKSLFADDMNLRCGEIRGLYLDGTQVKSINGNGLRVKSNVFLRNGFKANGQIGFVGAEIGGILDCSMGGFTNVGGLALTADGIIVKGDVLLREGFKAEGGIRMLGADIGGDFDCRKGAFTNVHGHALSADGIKVKGGVFLAEGFKAQGEVRMPMANIGSVLSCIEGEFINEGGKALNAGGIKIKGAVFFREGFRAKGEVRFQGAVIGGDLDCIAGEFTNAGRKALNVQNAKIGGNVLMREAFNPQGTVSLVFAHISGSLEYLDVESPDKATLDLRSAKVGTLYDNENSWPAKGNLLMDGFEYDIIADKAEKDAEMRLKWLRLQPEDQFRPQPYEQLAKVLEKMGHENDARKIRIAKNNDRLRIEKNKIPWYERYWLRLLGKSISYGYRPLKAIPWMTGFIMLGLILFGAGYEAGVFSPLSPTAYIADKVTGDQVISPDYPTFNVLAYSFNEFVPLINLRQGSYWMPNANKCGEIHLFGKLKIPISGSLLRYYLWVHIVAGWVLTSLLVAGLSGLVRK